MASGLEDALVEEVEALFGDPPTLALDGAPERRPRRRRQRDGEDDDDRQARAEAARARPLGARRRGRHVPRGRGGAARDLGRARRRGLRRRPARRGSGCRRVRRGRGGAGARARRRDHRHRRAPAHADEPHGRAREGAARDRRPLDGAPHETLLVVDATTGQNGLQQARLFGEAVGVTGVALTKLDGSARGGVAIAIAVELGLPVKLVGVGEGVDDLRPFDAHDYARALVAG